MRQFSLLPIFGFLLAGPLVAGPTFDTLKAEARKRASAPYVPATTELDAYWKNLTYDQHRDIRFKMESGLWAKEKLPYSIDFFHPGWTAK